MHRLVLVLRNLDFQLTCNWYQVNQIVALCNNYGLEVFLPNTKVDA